MLMSVCLSVGLSVGRSVGGHYAFYQLIKLIELKKMMD